MTRPDVSILVLSCDRPERLIETIDSIRAQTHEGFECIVCDDGSRDERTLAYLDDLPNRDARFRVLFGPRYRGVEKAQFCTAGAVYNAGMAFLQGAFVSALGVGGAGAPRRIERLLAYLRAHPCCDVVWGLQRLLRVDPDGRPIGEPPDWGEDEHHAEQHVGAAFAARLAGGNFIDICSTLARAAVAERFPFSTDPAAWPDMDWRRHREMAQAGVRFDFWAVASDTKRTGPSNLGRRIAAGEPLASVLEPRERTG